MDNSQSSPDGEITFRPTSHRPKFDDLQGLPTTLKALQRVDRGTPRTTDMSALANRMRSIRLDKSPEETPESQASPSLKVAMTKPCRLEFDDQDKENAHNQSMLKSARRTLEIRPMPASDVEDSTRGMTSFLEMGLRDIASKDGLGTAGTVEGNPDALRKLSPSEYKLDASNDFPQSSPPIEGVLGPKLADLSSSEYGLEGSDDFLRSSPQIGTEALGPKLGELSSSSIRLEGSDDFLRSSNSSDYQMSHEFSAADKSEEAKGSTEEILVNGEVSAAAAVNVSAVEPPSHDLELGTGAEPFTAYTLSPAVEKILSRLEQASSTDSSLPCTEQEDSDSRDTSSMENELKLDHTSSNLIHETADIEPVATEEEPSIAEQTTTSPAVESAGSQPVASSSDLPAVETELQFDEHTSTSSIPKASDIKLPVTEEELWKLIEQTNTTTDSEVTHIQPASPEVEAEIVEPTRISPAVEDSTFSDSPAISGELNSGQPNNSSIPEMDLSGTDLGDASKTKGESKLADQSSTIPVLEPVGIELAAAEEQMDTAEHTLSSEVKHADMKPVANSLASEEPVVESELLIQNNFGQTTEFVEKPLSDSSDIMKNDHPPASHAVALEPSEPSGHHVMGNIPEEIVKSEAPTMGSESETLDHLEASSDVKGPQVDKNTMKDFTFIGRELDGQKFMDHDLVNTNMQIVIEGSPKWNWAERSGAMSFISRYLQSPSYDSGVVGNALPTLTSKIVDALDELRPSLISSALTLVTEIVSCGCDKGTAFAEEVFPSVLDIACGSSLTAEAAANCVAILLNVYESLASELRDADHPEILRDFLTKSIDSSQTSVLPRSQAVHALQLVDRWMEARQDTVTPRTQELSNDVRSEESPTNNNEFDRSPSASIASQRLSGQDLYTPRSEALSSRMVHSQSLRPKSLSISSSPSPMTLLSTISSLAKEGDVLTPNTKLPRDGMRVSSSRKNTPRPVSFPISSLRRVEPGTPVLQNMRLGGSSRKTSPGSGRRRMYTEDEMIDARKDAKRMALEEARQAQVIEKSAFRREKNELEERVRTEHSEVVELKSVLQEYELAMQRMVSQMNSKANADRSSLEHDNNKLKGELLEVAEAFEKLKEKYESSKDTIAVLENKETRLIEQLKELKKNMVELQKWSNDLKANCEKKLALAFENVTKCRTLYMDKEAHASKALSDLERTQLDLEKETASHTETASALSQLETALHVEQDKTSSLQSSLETTKESLGNATAHRDKLKVELSETKPKLSKAMAELDRLQDAENRATEAENRLHASVVESRALKARAYDDMTRIRAIEGVLATKEKEVEEMNNICEELMSRLEQFNN